MRGSKSLLKLETKETEKCVEEYTSLFSDVFCEKCVDEVTEKCVAEKVAKNLHTEMSVLGLFLLPLKKNGHMRDCLQNTNCFVKGKVKKFVETSKKFKKKDWDKCKLITEKLQYLLPIS